MLLISSINTRKIADSKALHIVVFVIAMISFMLNSSNARAATVMPSDYRLAAANDKFADTWQIAVAFRMRLPWRLRVKRMELTVGTRFPLPKRAGRLSRVALADLVQS